MPGATERRDPFEGRENLADRTGERWRPPHCGQAQGGLGRVGAAIRRYFDVQAGSVWRDVAPELEAARGTLVDVGCGAQPYRPLLDASVDYIGIDITEAEDQFGYHVPGTRYFSGDTWPVEDGIADVVLSTETLEHVEKPPVFLREAFRCLRPGGKLILTVPFAARWHFVPHDYWRFTPSSLSLLLTESGFENPRVYARGNALTVAAYKLMAVGLTRLLPQQGTPTRRLATAAIAVPTVPVVVFAAIVANLSLRSAGGEDCLGYTVLAERPAADA